MSIYFRQHVAYVRSQLRIWESKEVVEAEAKEGYTAITDSDEESDIKCKRLFIELSLRIGAITI